jgi:hypothetical protein
MDIVQIGLRKVPDLFDQDWNFQLAWKVPHVTDEFLDVYGKFASVEEAVKVTKSLMSTEATFALVARRKGAETSMEYVAAIESDGTVTDCIEQPQRPLELMGHGWLLSA